MGSVTVRATLALIIGATIAVGDSGTRSALADQCQAVTPDQANKAAALLPEKAQFLWYCQSCGDKVAGGWQTITELVVAGSGAVKREVRINGKPLDLAYVYFIGTDGKAYNVALRIGCKAVGVAEALDLKKPEPPPPVLKRYKLTLTVEILTSKANGKRWDPAGDAPDPIVKATMFQSEKKVRELNCRQKDSYTSTCLSGTVIDADANTVINASLEDEDAVSNDTIGYVSMPLADAIANERKATTVKTTGGQLKSATLTLTAVE